MDPMSALALLSSPTGAKGGGGSLPNFDQQIKSAASSSLDASNSNYSQTTGNFIVGGSQNSPWVMLGIAAVALIFVLRK